MKSFRKTLITLVFLFCLFSPAAAQKNNDTVTYSQYTADGHTTMAKYIDIDYVPESMPITYDNTYNIENQFEINVVTRPVISGFVNRDTGKDFPYILPDGRTVMLNPVYESARNEDNGTLFVMRVKFRNLTHKSFLGLAKNSFMLSGYVRNRRVTYPAPILIQRYDWAEGAWRNERNWDIENENWMTLEPLRELDLLVIFQVHPFLHNWEFTVYPHPPIEYGEPDSYDFGLPAVYSSKYVGGNEGVIVTYPDIEPQISELAPAMESDPERKGWIFQFPEVMNTNTNEVMKPMK